MRNETKDRHYYECLQLAARCMASYDAITEYESTGSQMIAEMIFTSYPEIVWA